MIYNIIIVSIVITIVLAIFLKSEKNIKKNNEIINKKEDLIKIVAALIAMFIISPITISNILEFVYKKSSFEIFLIILLVIFGILNLIFKKKKELSTFLMFCKYLIYSVIIINIITSILILLADYSGFFTI